MVGQRRVCQRVRFGVEQFGRVLALAAAVCLRRADAMRAPCPRERRVPPHHLLRRLLRHWHVPGGSELLRLRGRRPHLARHVLRRWVEPLRRGEPRLVASLAAAALAAAALAVAATTAAALALAAAALTAAAVASAAAVANA